MSQDRLSGPSSSPPGPSGGRRSPGSCRSVASDLGRWRSRCSGRSRRSTTMATARTKPVPVRVRTARSRPGTVLTILPSVSWIRTSTSPTTSANAGGMADRRPDLGPLGLDPGGLDPERERRRADLGQVVGVERLDQLDLAERGRLLDRQRRAVGERPVGPRARRRRCRARRRAPAAAPSLGANSGKLAQGSLNSTS